MTMEQIDNERFISFEGIDYSGKTTQIELLKSYLEDKGHAVAVLREPGGTAISEKIRAILLDKNNMDMSDRAEVFLYSAARVQLVKQKIIPLLKKGVFVIADRYVDSTTAYQGYGRGIDLQVIDQINRAATFNLLPGITFYLHLSAAEAEKRRLGSGREADRLEEAGLEFYKKIIGGYLELHSKEPERILKLDALLTIEELHKNIVKTL